MNKPKPDSNPIFLLRLGTFLCFAGWTWVHFYWEGPYGILLWQDATYAFAERLGVSWDAFVGTGADDGLIQKWIAWIGWLYLGCTILPSRFEGNRGSRWQRWQGAAVCSRL